MDLLLSNTICNNNSQSSLNKFSSNHPKYLSNLHSFSNSNNNFNKTKFNSSSNNTSNSNNNSSTNNNNNSKCFCSNSKWIMEIEWITIILLMKIMLMEMESLILVKMALQLITITTWLTSKLDSLINYLSRCSSPLNQYPNHNNKEFLSVIKMEIHRMCLLKGIITWISWK